MTDWISVEERPPGEDEEVLVACRVPSGYFLGIATLRGVFFRWSPRGGFAQGVTHWMPLPKPPELKS